MSYFTGKMHQIRFRLGLAPDPAGSALDPRSGFKGRTSIGEGSRGSGGVALLEGSRG